MKSRQTMRETMWLDFYTDKQIFLLGKLAYG